MTGPILPGATIGILGSGQLGRMLAIAARQMGYRVHTFSPESGTPTGQVADREYSAPYDDLDAIGDFARGVDVVTLEFENIPVATVDAVIAHAPVRPDRSVLYTTQNRLREKTFLDRAGIPVARFRHIRSADDLRSGLRDLGHPAILKTAGFGYDGKGQIKISAPDQIENALAAIGVSTAGSAEETASDGILETFVDFEREVSVVAARSLEGEFAHYGVIENSHCQHILDVSIAPASLPPDIAREAAEIAYGVLEELDVVGVLCVEFFLTRDGKLLVNELAPRPHNSGHLTVDASITSQFEQQLRAVCGLPLGSTELLMPAAMANLLGDLWQDGEPDWAAACDFPDVKLHLYGKRVARPGRKMGHLTALAGRGDEAARIARAARAALTSAGQSVDPSR